MDNWTLPKINFDRCSGCSFCSLHCPEHVVIMENGLPVLNAPSSCTYCGICEDICPVGAIELVYQIMPLAIDPGSKTNQSTRIIK